MRETHTCTPRRRPTLEQRAAFFNEHETNVPEQIHLEHTPLLPTLALVGVIGMAGVAFLVFGGALMVGDALVVKWTRRPFQSGTMAAGGDRW